MIIKSQFFFSINQNMFEYRKLSITKSWYQMFGHILSSWLFYRTFPDLDPNFRLYQGKRFPHKNNSVFNNGMVNMISIKLHFSKLSIISGIGQP